MKKETFILTLIFAFLNFAPNCQAFDVTNDKDNKKELIILLNYEGDNYSFYHKIKIGETKKDLAIQKEEKKLAKMMVYLSPLLDKEGNEITKDKDGAPLKNGGKIYQDTLSTDEKALLMTIDKKEIKENGQYRITNDGKSFAQEGEANTQK